MTATSTSGASTITLSFPNNGDTGTEAVTYTVTNNLNLLGLGVGATLTNGTGTITSSVVCFASGTRIRTIGGDVAVEDLRAGDVAVTASGEHRPIRWLGHRTIDCGAHPRRWEVLPVRIAAHAFGENRPERDVLVSPGHSICVDVLGEVLIPACALLNGSTVRQIEVDEVTYWHVELDSHDILVADNLPAESYIEMDNRSFFGEHEVTALDASPDGNPLHRTHADFCRPFHSAGPLVDAVRAQLQRRASELGWTLVDSVDLHLEVDGKRVEPVVRDLTVRFHVPASASKVWLVSPTVRPRDMAGMGDERDLGVPLKALQIEDGLDVSRSIAIDSPLLSVGLHDVEDGCRRWTGGRTLLPEALWEGCEDGFYLRLALACRPLPRWVRASKPRPQLYLAA